MVITGCLSEIEKQLDWYLSLFKESVLLNNEFAVEFTITSNGRKIIPIDKATLEEMEYRLIDCNLSDRKVFVIDEEIYRLFRVNNKQRNDKVGNFDDSQEMPKVKPIHKTEIKKTKTERHITKATKSEKSGIPNQRIVNEDEIPNTYIKGKTKELNDEYRIEEHLEDSVRLSKPCVFGIKYIDDNLFVLFYRNSVYDRGTDTTFRHYLCQQPGTLVAYIYFKDLDSLRYQFEQFGKKLRHNGHNILSRMQSDQLVHHFAWCWI